MENLIVKYQELFDKATQEFICVDVMSSNYYILQTKVKNYYYFLQDLNSAKKF